MNFVNYKECSHVYVKQHKACERKTISKLAGTKVRLTKEKQNSHKFSFAFSEFPH